MLMETTADTTPPAGLLATIATDTAAAEELLDADGVMITRAEAADVLLFLESDRGKAWFAQLTTNAYYTQWYDYNRSPHEMKWCTQLAEKILDMKRAGACPGEIEDMIEAEFSGGQSAEEVYEEEHEQATTKAVAAIADALDELREEDETVPEVDRDEWEEVLKDRIVEAMYETDDSSVMDLFGSYDRCEIVFRLNKEDVYSQKPWADFDHLAINADLQQALAAMGYTIGDYRRMTGNKESSNGLGRVRRRPQPLLSEQELRELVSEACSTHFSFVLYAMVPVHKLVTLDLEKPISLSNYSIASYDGMNGTFYEISRKEAITIMPGEAELMAPYGYSPDSICGLYHPPFHAEIANVE